jgi:hypothetical protein
MGWKEWYQKGKERRVRARHRQHQAQAFVLGGLLAGAGAHGLYTEIAHFLTSTSATATLLERHNVCEFEYRSTGKEQMSRRVPCEEARPVAGFVGRQIGRTEVARIRFKLADGSEHEATVNEKDLFSYGKKIGAELPISYVPGDPDEVRAAPTWTRLSVLFSLFAVGALILALVFGPPVMAARRWLKDKARGNPDQAPGLASAAAPMRPAVSGYRGLAQIPRQPSVVGARRANFGFRS